MEGVKLSQTLGMTREVGKGNSSGSDLVRRRRDGPELKVRERRVREALNFYKMSLPRIEVGHLGGARNK